MDLWLPTISDTWTNTQTLTHTQTHKFIHLEKCLRCLRSLSPLFNSALIQRIIFHTKPLRYKCKVHWLRLVFTFSLVFWFRYTRPVTKLYIDRTKSPTWNINPPNLLHLNATSIEFRSRFVLNSIAVCIEFCLFFSESNKVCEPTHAPTENHPLHHLLHPRETPTNHRKTENRNHKTYNP